MYIKNEESVKIAEFLLQIQSVQINPTKPFQWSSGWLSPIYCDNRKILSYPEVRAFVKKIMSDAILQKYGKPEVIAGVATGGIAIGVLVAEALDVPFVYVRSSKKGHGLENQIEGVLNANQSVVVVEDLISSGKSSLKAVDAIRSISKNIKGVVSIFNYGFDVAKQAFDEKNCDFLSLTDYPTILDIAKKQGIINDKHLPTLYKWQENPSNWKG